MDIKTLEELYNIVSGKFYELTDIEIDENDIEAVAFDKGKREIYNEIALLIADEIEAAEKKQGL